VFGLVGAGSVGLTFTPWFERSIYGGYVGFNACASAWMLSLLGEQVTCTGAELTSGDGFLAIGRGCTAVEPTLLVVAAILAGPTSWLRRLAASVVAILLLGALNLLRIVSLFFVDRHWPAAFDSAHHEIWPVLILLVAGVLAYVSMRGSVPVAPDGA
jgi:exosortase/archaeosortase family protein